MTNALSAPVPVDLVATPVEGKAVRHEGHQRVRATFLDRDPDRPWALAGSWVEAPTLVYGRQDKLVDTKAAHRATMEFSVANVIVIPDSGHVAMMEHPELVDRWWREQMA